MFMSLSMMGRERKQNPYDTIQSSNNLAYKQIQASVRKRREVGENMH